MTVKVRERLRTGGYAFCLRNFANPDMLGHAGGLDAGVKAVETVDRGLEKIAEAVLEHGGTLLVTADHGNIEQMRDSASGRPHTAHTLNKVPLVLACGDDAGALGDGSLADVAPTVLAILGLEKPAEMTGRSLLGVAESGRRAAG